MLATTLVDQQPFEDVREPLVLLVLEKRIVRQGIPCLFQGPALRHIVFPHAVIGKIVLLDVLRKHPQKLHLRRRKIGIPDEARGRSRLESPENILQGVGVKVAEKVERDIKLVLNQFEPTPDGIRGNSLRTKQDDIVPLGKPARNQSIRGALRFNDQTKIDFFPGGELQILRTVLRLEGGRPEFGKIDCRLRPVGHCLVDNKLLAVGLAAAVVGVAIQILTVALHHLCDEINDLVALVLAFEVERPEGRVVFHLSLRDVVDFTLRVGRSNVEVPKHDLQKKNRAGHLLDRTHVQFRGDFFRAGGQVANLLAVNGVVEGAFGRHQDRPFRLFQIAQELLAHLHGQFLNIDIGCHKINAKFKMKSSKVMYFSF